MLQTGRQPGGQWNLLLSLLLAINCSTHLVDEVPDVVPTHSCSFPAFCMYLKRSIEKSANRHDDETKKHEPVPCSKLRREIKFIEDGPYETHRTLNDQPD